MGIALRDLRQGDLVIYRSHGSIIESKVAHIEGTTLSATNANYTISFESGDIFVFEENDNLQRGVRNLVSKHKRDRLPPPGKTPFEVLTFYTQGEYDSTNDEKEYKKKIVAKFRDYDEAVEYAQKKALDRTYEYVILRA